jgi:hypothetical protein
MVKPASAAAVDISLSGGHRYPLPGVVALKGRALVKCHAFPPLLIQDAANAALSMVGPWRAPRGCLQI